MKENSYKNEFSLLKTEIEKQYASCSDIVIHKFTIGSVAKTDGLLIYFDGMCNKNTLNEFLLEHLLHDSFLCSLKKQLSENNFSNIIPLSDIHYEKNTAEIYSCINFGDAALVLSDIPGYFHIAAKDVPSRNVEEPKTENTIYSPKEGFTENIRTNTALLRRRIQNENLKFENTKIGTVSHTIVITAYIDGIVDKKKLEECNSLLSDLSLHSLFDTKKLQTAIEKKHCTIFPLSKISERCDDAAHALSTGKIVILIDNSPFCLILPVHFREFLCTSEDRSQNSFFQYTFLALRVICVILTLFLPAAYIAAIDFNPEFFSDKIILYLMDSRRYIPFPAFWEIMFVEFIFEILVEAGLRLPKQISSTIGIVGSIILGQALVDANLVNMTVIIIVSLSAVSTFVIPNYALSLSLRLLKCVFMVLSAMFGFYAIMILSIFTLVHLVSLNNFSSPYFM